MKRLALVLAIVLAAGAASALAQVPPPPEPGSTVRTAAVRENVLSVRVRTRQGFPLPRRMAWFAPDGSRVRVVRFP